MNLNSMHVKDAVSYYLLKEWRKVRRMAENAHAIGIEHFSSR